MTLAIGQEIILSGKFIYGLELNMHEFHHIFLFWMILWVVEVAKSWPGSFFMPFKASVGQNDIC